MVKKTILRGLLGFPIGVCIGATITIIISWILAGGYYAPIVPGFKEAVGTEIGAVTLQYFLTGLVGVGCAASSVIFEIEKWSIFKQTGIHFLAISISMLPVAYICQWMDHSFLGFISYFGIFAIIYFLIWLMQYFIWRKNIKEINDHLK